MAHEITTNLFGLDPVMFEAQRQQQDDANAFAMSQLQPGQASKQAAFSLTNAFGRDLNSMLGVQDPEMQANAKLRALQQQFLQSGGNPQTSEGLAKFAQVLAQNGLPEKAQAAMAKAMELGKAQAEINFKGAETGKVNAQSLEALRKASGLGSFDPDKYTPASFQKFLTTGGKDASVLELAPTTRTADEQSDTTILKQLQTQFGNEQGAILFQKYKDKMKNATTIRGQDLVNERQRDLHTDTVAEHRRLEDQKQAEKDAQAAQAREQKAAAFAGALDTLDRINTHPGKSAAVGFGGDTLSRVPGTDAFGFRTQLDTFKAQTFVPMVAALKGMGALSDAEGKKLTDAVGALAQGMPQDEFDSQIGVIRKMLDSAKEKALQMTSTEKERSVRTANGLPSGVDRNTLLSEAKRRGLVK